MTLVSTIYLWGRGREFLSFVGGGTSLVSKWGGGVLGRTGGVTTILWLHVSTQLVNYSKLYYLLTIIGFTLILLKLKYAHDYLIAFSIFIIWQTSRVSVGRVSHDSLLRLFWSGKSFVSASA